MVMKRFVLVAAAVVSLGTMSACDKPTAEDCRRAIANMQKLLGADVTGLRTTENEGEVRRCKGGSTKASVACAKNATTAAELKSCEFMASKGKK
jgi:hypothetical protein